MRGRLSFFGSPLLLQRFHPSIPPFPFLVPPDHSPVLPAVSTCFLLLGRLSRRSLVFCKNLGPISIDTSYMPSRISTSKRRCALRYAVMVIALLAAAAEAGAQRLPSSVIVRLRPGASPKAVQEAVATVSGGSGLRGRVRPLFTEAPKGRSTLAAGRLDRYLIVEGDAMRQPELLAALQGSGAVEAAFANHRYHIDAVPSDSLYGEQWALQKIEAEAAWQTTMGENSVLVGVIDTGIEFAHPDLAGALAINGPEDINRNGRFDPWPASETIDGVTGDLDGIDQDGNGYADDVIGYDFVDQTVQNVGDWSGRDAVPADEQAHGTNVAGVIAAQHNRFGVAGLAPGVRLVTLRAFDASGNAEDDDIAAAIVYAADRGVAVLNLSFGDYYDSPLMRDAIAYAYQRGVTIVASSGNEGGSDPHYPSSYPEVISVGATSRDDLLAFFSTYGSQLSMTAPGVDIQTTDLNGGYKKVSGTSFSSPYVAAAAALILSTHRNWSPDEVRATLELSSDDRGTRGWDINYGAGRLNVRRALAAPGPASVAIRTPQGDGGFGADSTIAVRGSALSPLLDVWQLFIGQGEIPDSWRPLTGPQGNGKLNDRLGDITGSDLDLPGGVLTLRLMLRQTDGRETERRVRLFYDQGKPVVERLDTGNVWRFQERAYGVIARTDQRSMLVFWLRRAGNPDEPYRKISLEPERTGFAREHYLLLTSSEMERDLPYEAFLEFRTPSGDTTLVGSPQSPLTIVRRGEAFSSTMLGEQKYDLPHGYLLDQTERLFGGELSVALNRFRDGSYDKLMIYSFDSAGRRFMPRDSIGEQWIPRGFGDTDGDGLRELLVQARGAGVIYQQRTPGGAMLGNVVYADTVAQNFWGSALADLDGDGRSEVIARTDNNNQEPGYFYVSRRRGNTLERIAELPNTTSPARGDSRNKFGPPLSAVADFDGDGRSEILFGDDDGDFMIYEREGDGSYREVWKDENDGEGGSEYVAAGDLDGDGRAEAIVAYHSRTVGDFSHEYDPPFWTVKVFSFDAEGKARLLWQDRVAYVRPTLPFLFFSGISTGDLDRNPGRELALSFFPSLYVLTWDRDAGTLKPFWFAEGSISNKPLITDFNGDGIGEIGIGDGEKIKFYQINPTFPGPPAPSGFKGWTLNDSTSYLQWNAVPGADYYTLYRALSVPGQSRLQFDSVVTTTALSIVDTGFRAPGGRLLRDRLYYYIVTARDTSLSPQDSLLSNAVVLFMHPPSQVLQALPADARTLRVVMDFRIKDELYEPGIFDIIPEEGGAPLEVSSVTTADRFSFLVRLRDQAPGRRVIVRPTRLYRDFYDSPADTNRSVVAAMPQEEPDGERFIATRGAALSATEVSVEFNFPVDAATAADPSNYRFGPDGTIVAARVDPADSRRVILTLAGSAPIGPYGKIYTVTIDGVRAANGRLVNDGAGSVVGFTVDAGDLQEVFVYPHPFSISRDGAVTFAGLTRVAEIRIFTQAGRHIRTLEAREGHGGAEWRGDDDRGVQVSTGIYLYTVVGSTPDGREFESEPRKIAVVP